MTIDDLIAIRFLQLLVTPFDKWDAYKLGIIDANGKQLLKYDDLKTNEQRSAWTLLHRVVHRIKLLINKLPTDANNFKTLAAAYLLVKEQMSFGEEYDPVHVETKFEDLLHSNVTLMEETHAIANAYRLLESSIANVTGPMVSTDVPFPIQYDNEKRQRTRHLIAALRRKREKRNG